MSYYRYTSSSPNYYRPSLFGGFKFFPPVIKYLLISNVAVFFFAQFLTLFHLKGVSLNPNISDIFALYPLGDGFRPWQLVTYLFMHANLMHLFFNMLALWMFGMELENEWGSKKFLVYYLICGIGAGLANLFITPLIGVAGPTVGASGAIYGVLLAFGFTHPDQYVVAIPFFIPIKAKYFVMFWIAFEVLSLGASDGVAHFAHLGGAAVGLVYLLIDGGRLPFRHLWYQARHRFASPAERVNEYSHYERDNASDAKYYDVNDDDEHFVDQQRIDAILDKINQGGYKSLSEEEKRILFEASKKLN